ncbi:MAG: PKD domain-containing protein [bacterium]|nr:PKD domain-containing protein [bacterium]
MKNKNNLILKNSLYLLAIFSVVAGFFFLDNVQKTEAHVACGFNSFPESSVEVGETVSVTMRMADHHELSPWTYSYAWGDGSGDSNIELPEYISVRTVTHTYQDPGTYKFQFEFLNGAGTSCSKDEKITVLPPSSNPPPSPFSLDSISCSGASNPYVDLSWNSSSGATGYNVERRINSNGSWYDLGKTTNTSHRDSSPVIDATNYYRVIASNSSGQTISDNTLSKDINSANCGGSDPEPPSPTNVVCSPANTSVIIGQQITFTASGGNGTYNWSAPGSSQPSGSGLSITTSYSSTGTKTITLSSADLSDTCSAEVNPVPSAWVDLKVDNFNGPITVDKGSNVTVSWTSGNVSNCQVSPTGWTGTSDPGKDARVDQDTIFSISCDNGAATDSVTVNVRSSQPGTCSDVNIPSTYTPGQNINVSFRGPDFSASYFPTWSSANGQDDLIWYPGNRNGDYWTASIPSSSHGPSTSSINTHVYTYPPLELCAGREIQPLSSGGGGALGFNISYTPNTGTLSINSNVSSSWTISGIGRRPASGTATSSTDSVSPGNYTITPAQISGYNAAVSPSSTVSVTSSGFTTANINYAPIPLNQPNITNVNNAICGQLTVNWSYTPTGIEESFSVWRSTTAGNLGSAIATGLSPAARSYTDTTAIINTSYWYTVKVHTSIGGNREAVSAQNGPTLNLSCIANLGNSSKTLHQINGQPYSSSTLIQNADTLTFQITINNAGPSTAQVNYICDYPSANITNFRNLSVSGGGSAGSITPNSPACGGGTLIGVSGSKPVGNPNWIVQFDTTFTSQTEDQFEVCQNTANINYTDGTGTKNQGTNFGPFLCKTGKGNVPDFREVAP